MLLNTKQRGFTIVELLIVIVVIAILAAISVVAYNGIQERAVASQLGSAVAQGGKMVKLHQAEHGSYPTSLSQVNNGDGLADTDGVRYRYSGGGDSFCLTATNDKRFFMMTESAAPSEGSCVNVARGATAPSSILTDGNTHYSPYYSGAQGSLQSVTVDLGQANTISMVKVWHYWADGRRYYQTKTEVSENGTNWQVVFDSTNDGEYQETSAGRVHSFSPRNVRYIRDWINGSTSNSGNHWLEIQAY